jgi:hypothetical protein
MRRGHVYMPGEEMPGSASSIRLSISITCDPTIGDHLNLVHLKKVTSPMPWLSSHGVARGGR